MIKVVRVKKLLTGLILLFTILSLTGCLSAEFNAQGKFRPSSGELKLGDFTGTLTDIFNFFGADGGFKVLITLILSLIFFLGLSNQKIKNKIWGGRESNQGIILAISLAFGTGIAAITPVELLKGLFGGALLIAVNAGLVFLAILIIPALKNRLFKNQFPKAAAWIITGIVALAFNVIAIGLNGAVTQQEGLQLPQYLPALLGIVGWTTLILTIFGIASIIIGALYLFSFLGEGFESFKPFTKKAYSSGERMGKGIAQGITGERIQRIRVEEAEKKQKEITKKYYEQVLKAINNTVEWIERFYNDVETRKNEILNMDNLSGNVLNKVKEKTIKVLKRDERREYRNIKELINSLKKNHSNEEWFNKSAIIKLELFMNKVIEETQVELEKAENKEELIKKLEDIKTDEQDLLTLLKNLQEKLETAITKLHS